MERIVNTVEENTGTENIMEVWKDYTTEDASLLQKKPSSLKQKIPAGGNHVQLCMRSQDLWQPTKEIVKEIVDVAKRWGVCVMGFKIWISEKFKS